MSARFAVALVIAIAGSWVAAASAAALEPGVFIDPGSPAGKEYTAPLTALRGQATGHPAGRDQTPPLFGIGITPAGTSSGPGGVGAGTQPGAASSRALSGAPHGNAAGARGQAGGHRGTRANARGAHGTAARAGFGAGSRIPRTAPARGAVGGLDAIPVALLAVAVVFGGLAVGAVVLAGRRRLE